MTRKIEYMPHEDIFNLKLGDVFYYNNYYVNSEMIHKKHSYKCEVMHVLIDQDALQGILIKRWLITKKKWSYEFFDFWKIEFTCSLKRKFK